MKSGSDKFKFLQLYNISFCPDFKTLLTLLFEKIQSYAHTSKQAVENDVLDAEI